MSRRRFRIAAQAKRDLNDIWDYVAERSTLRVADTTLDEIQRGFPLLAQFPEMGVLRKELTPTLRSFVVGEFLIFYRPIKGGIEIARVLRGSRDIERLFRGEESEENLT